MEKSKRRALSVFRQAEAGNHGTPEAERSPGACGVANHAVIRNDRAARNRRRPELRCTAGQEQAPANRQLIGSQILYIAAPRSGLEPRIGSARAGWDIQLTPTRSNRRYARRDSGECGGVGILGGNRASPMHRAIAERDDDLRLVEHSLAAVFLNVGS